MIKTLPLLISLFSIPSAFAGYVESAPITLSAPIRLGFNMGDSDLHYAATKVADGYCMREGKGIRSVRTGVVAVQTGGKVFAGSTELNTLSQQSKYGFLRRREDPKTQPVFALASVTCLKEIPGDSIQSPHEVLVSDGYATKVKAPVEKDSNGISLISGTWAWGDQQVSSSLRDKDFERFNTDTTAEAYR